MLRLVVFLLAIAAIATGLSWLADRPGLIVVNWQGYEGEISVFHAVVALTFLVGVAILAWSLLRAVWSSPATVGNYFYKRRQKRGLDALSSGIIAIGAGDRTNATRYAIQARKTLPNEPLTHLLRAQAAQLSGDKTTARRIFEAMLSQPDTEQLGLRGLFLEAHREGELEAARQFADRALALNPKLAWSTDALFDLQCKNSDWAGALQTLASAKKHGHIDKDTADRRRAVLLTAQAQKAEDQDPDRALSLALEAHNLAPNLVPAAAIAGRLLASRGNTPKAAKVLQKTWLKSPHPDLATAYSFARLGDSPRDRLDRIKQLAGLLPNSLESPIAVARVAIESRDFATARAALEPLLEGRMTQRVATLMARIEGEEHGDKGRVREWLARAVNAPRDPAWTADGVVSESWAPVSPVTGQLDAFQWRVPVEHMERSEGDLLAQKLEELVALGAPLEAIEAKPIDVGTTTSTATEVASTTASKAPTPQTARGPATGTRPQAIEVVDAETVTATVTPQRTAAQTATQTSSAPTPAPAPAPAATTFAAAASIATPAKADVTVAAKSTDADAGRTSSAVASPVTPTKPATIAAAPGTTAPVVSAPVLPAPPVVIVKAAEKGAAVEAKTVVSVAARTQTSGAAATPGNGKPAGSEAKPAEAKIFVSPRSPDDPGPDAADTEEQSRAIPRYVQKR